MHFIIYFYYFFFMFSPIWDQLEIWNYASEDPLAKYFPSGENATELILYLCPSNVWTLVFASKFHNLIVLKGKNKFAK